MNLYESIKSNQNFNEAEEKTLVTIYQVPTGKDYTFMDYDFAKEHGFNFADYEKVADIEVPISTDLEEIFTLGNTHKDMFNASRDKFRSISVSDIIEKDGKKYYVDSFGFKEV